MKVYITKPRNHWISPYTIIEKIVFWKEIDYDNPIVKKTSDILTPLCVGIQKVLDIIHPDINYIKIDYYDTWSMDSTLSPIILPMLKQLKRDKHGAPHVDDCDVPDELKSTSAPPKENTWDADANHFKRWDYVLDEMIWAHQQLTDRDNDERFWLEHGEIDWEDKTPPDENGCKPIVWKKKSKVDWDGLKAHYDRIDNGVRLFGRYYRSLWD